MTDIKTLEKKIKDKDLLARALTHKSWGNENKDKKLSNERLEFLGDAVLELVVSQALYEQFPDKEEGYLTALRANLVNTTNLARVAKELGVGQILSLSKGEEEGGGRENPSLLADTMEAIIGALYLDQGYEVVSEFVEVNLLKDVPEKVKQPLKDAKSRLQEGVQAKGMPAPRYKVVKETGPDHAKNFVLEVAVNGKVLGVGKGNNKSVAEQNAAERALKAL